MPWVNTSTIFQHLEIKNTILQKYENGKIQLLRLMHSYVFKLFRRVPPHIVHKNLDHSNGTFYDILDIFHA